MRAGLGAAAAAAVMLPVARGPAAEAPRERVETVSFADPRWSSVKVIRGIPATRPAKVAVTMPAAARRLPKVAAATTDIVTFGTGRADRVVVIRGRPPSEPRAVPGPSLVRMSAASDFGSGSIALFGAGGGELDRVAFAVDGAESGHGSNLAMWRPDLDGPQGPMQVSAAAALDVGGGDRFDLRQNRLIGRAYLAKLYGRYGNWPDAIAAYNWGPGNLDLWIANGRPVDALPLETARYLLKVLRDALLPGSS